MVLYVFVLFWYMSVRTSFHSSPEGIPGTCLEVEESPRDSETRDSIGKDSRDLGQHQCAAEWRPSGSVTDTVQGGQEGPFRKAKSRVCVSQGGSDGRGGLCLQS